LPTGVEIKTRKISVGGKIPPAEKEKDGRK